MMFYFILFFIFIFIYFYFLFFLLFLFLAFVLLLHKLNACPRLAPKVSFRYALAVYCIPLQAPLQVRAAFVYLSAVE